MPVFLPGKSHGQRSLEGYIQSVGRKESDMIEVTWHARTYRGGEKLNDSHLEVLNQV